jgi:hypothetical protein
MRTTGPGEVSLRIQDQSAGAGRGAGRASGPKTGLKAGAVVSIAVRERIGPDPRGGGELYRVSLGARSLTASVSGLSSGALEPGSILKARVERSGSSTVLRVAAADSRELSSAALARALTAAQLPNDAAARGAAAALLREGIAPDARAVARVRRAALKDGIEGGERCDLAAKMEAKGIPADEAALESLLLAADSSGSEGRSPGEGGSGEEGRSSAGAPPGATTQATELSIPEAELPRALASLLRELVSRVGVEAGPEGRALALFNHLRGPEGSWVIVPFRFSLDEVDFAGSFRIQLPYVRGGQGAFEARFSASRGSSAEDWAFCIDFRGGKAASLRVEAPEGRIAVDAERFERFAASLAPLTCSSREGRLGARQGGEPEAGGARGLDLDA